MVSSPEGMTSEALVSLLEEMMDLKIQIYTDQTMKCSPEVARVLEEKRKTDKRRLEQIHREIVRFLSD